MQLDMDVFPSKPILVRCLVTIAGPLALFISSVICLGILHAGLSFFTSFPQFVGFLLSPAIKGKQLLSILFDKLQLPPIVAFGIFAAKVTAFNLFPLASVPGGRLLVEITKARDKSVLARILNHFSSFAAFILIICLLIAVVGFFRRL